MDSMYVSDWIPSDLMGKTVMNRRSPFKVHQALWNPRINLLALASQKGEICVRRLYWRRGWKRDIYDIKPILLDRMKTENEIHLETMCWSPDGKILASAFSDGCIHHLDAEKGIVRFTVRSKTCIKRMRWQSYKKLKTNSMNDDALCGVHGNMLECEGSNDKSEELNQLKAMKAFCNGIALNLLGTLLFTIDENNVVQILAAGVLPIASIEPPMQFMGNCDPYSIVVGDLFYCNQQSRFIVVYSSMGQISSTGAPGMNTQVVGFDIDKFGCIKNGLIWTIVRRWLQLVFYVCYISEAFARTIIDWEDQSKHFTEKFNSFAKENAPFCNLGDCFINMILTGHANPELVSFYRNVLKPTEWKKMTDWVNKGFSEMIANIGIELLPGAEALQHNMKQLYDEARSAIHSYRAQKLLPDRLFDVDIYPYGKYADENDDETLKELKNFQSLADDIVNKLNEMHLVAMRNRKDLVNFTNWLSQTAPFTAKSKLSATQMKFDLQLITEYIRQASQEKTESISGRNIEPGDSSDKSYSFDKVCQYFDRHKPLKYRLDVQSNSWNILPEEHSNRTLADSISDCLNGLQTMQEIILKNFTASVMTRTNTMLEQGHAEGFEKFTIFSPRKTTCKRPFYEERKWLQSTANVPFIVCCVGVDGTRLVIYEASGKILHKICYTEQLARNSATFSGSKEMLLAENLENSGMLVNVVSSKSFSDVQQHSPRISHPSNLMRDEKQCDLPGRLIHFEWYGGGIYYGLLKISKNDTDETVLFRCSLMEGRSYIHEDTSGCMESYCSFTNSCYRKFGIAFTENGFRAKLFEIQQSHVYWPRKHSYKENSSVVNIKPKVIQADEANSDDIDVVGMDVENCETQTTRENIRVRRSARKRKPQKK